MCRLTTKLHFDYASHFFGVNLPHPLNLYFSCTVPCHKTGYFGDYCWPRLLQYLVSDWFSNVWMTASNTYIMKGPRPITVYKCLTSRWVQHSQLESLGTDTFLCLFLASCGTSFKILFDNGANFVGGVQERPLIIWHLNWGTRWQISFPVQPHGLEGHSFFPLTNHLLYSRCFITMLSVGRHWQLKWTQSLVFELRNPVCWWTAWVSC